MKIADKRNKNKMKKEHKAHNLRAINEIYGLEHGPYKVVSFVNLGGSMDIINDKYFKKSTMNLFYYEEGKMNFLLVNTETFTDFEKAYITRVSDIVVFVINSNNPEAHKMRLIRKHYPSCLFVILDKKYKKIAKKFVKKNLPGNKIIEIEVLMKNLCSAKQANTIVTRRPYMVPFDVRIEDDFIYFKGYMKSGLQSNRITVNGKYVMEIEEVRTHRLIKGSELNMSDEEKSQFVIYNGLGSDTVETPSDDEQENLNDNVMDIEDDDFEEEHVYCDNSSENSESEHPSLIKEYSDYKGIRNISTCDFVTDKYPEYYNELIFFKDFKRVENYMLNRKSIIEDNQMVEIKVRLNADIKDNIFILFSNYEFEEYKTIFNFIFSSCFPVNNDRLLVDFGHKIIEISPSITKTAGYKVFKKEQELRNGTISFIAPIVFNASRIMGYESNLLKEIRIESYKFTGVNCLIKERKLLDEVVLKGRPIKVHKRSCIVRRMFYTKDEVLYFKNIRLTTKNARADGFIKKPIGVHGTFKAYFSSPILSGECIQMSLYKRIFIDDYTN